MSLMTTTATAAFFALLGSAASFITFEVPACPGAGATAINNNGVVTGSCGTGNGFLRDPSGHFTLFNAGGPTVPTAINYSGAVTGSYVGSEPPIPFARTFGFIRSADGAITTIILEGIFAPISPNGINAHGDIVGGVGGIGVNPFWFLRADAGGVITAPLGFFEGTAIAINEIGEIPGSSQDVSDVPHGVVLEPDGHTGRGAQPAGATASFPVGINRSGTVAGVFAAIGPQVQYEGYGDQGYIETAAGETSVFPLPYPIYIGGGAAGPVVSILKVGGGINAQGAVALENLYRAPDGTLTNIELGNCGSVKAYGINDHGVVVGSCTVPGELIRGFLWRK